MLIAFSGKAGSGKTTGANHVLSRLGGLVLPFAVAIKHEVGQFLHACEAGHHVYRMFGTQDEKHALFTIDTILAMHHCTAWQHYLDTHASLQTVPGQSVTSARLLMQWYGTDYRRAQDDLYWLKAWEMMADEQLSLGQTVICDDVRFPVEAESVRKRSGLLFRINRPGFGLSSNHPTEVAMDSMTDYDATLVNDGTLDDYYQKIDTQAVALGIL